mmetsp:Transcript_24900/g.41252  ORF Transcript_24900/g.41252 Transcript_24900/m.41252 type:complete len:492 (+) Transcript_24900:60-1535(+)
MIAQRTIINNNNNNTTNRSKRGGLEKNLAFVLALTLATTGQHHVAAFVAPLPSHHHRHVKGPPSVISNNINKPFTTTIQDTMVWAQPPQQSIENDDLDDNSHVSLLLAHQPNVDDDAPRKSTDPVSVMEQTFQTIFQQSAKSKHAAAFAAMTMLALAAPLPSYAAMSGGRMGGSFSSSSPSRAAPRTSNMPRSSSGSYSRGSSGGYGRGFTSGYASGLGTGYMTAPRIGYSPFVPSYPRTYYGGGYGGGGPGVISYNAGPSLGQLVFFGGLAFAVSSALKNNDSPEWSLPMDTTSMDATSSVLGPGNAVIKVSVALDVSNRDDPGSIISVLDRLGKTANTDTRKGIQSLTSQVALEVLRRKSSIVSASTEYKHFNSRSKALREFNNQATQERGKFERENIGANFFLGDRQQQGSKATMAVVTLVLSIDGDSTRVPRVGSLADVEDALRKIASDSKMDDCLQSVEILWTPEERTETLSLKDVIADYPSLRSV